VRTGHATFGSPANATPTRTRSRTPLLPEVPAISRGQSSLAKGRTRPRPRILGEMADARLARQSTLVTLLTFLGVLVAAVVAGVSGLFSESRVGLVLPLVVVVGIGLCVVALKRFEVYVMAMLIARASLDLVKLSGTVEGTPAAASSRALDPSSLLGVLFLIAASLWLAAQYRHHGALPGSALRRALLAFVAAAFLSVLGSNHVTAGALEWLRILAAVLMFVVLEQMMVDPDRMRRLLIAVYASTLFPLMFTASGFLTGAPRSELKGSFSRIVGPFNQSNSYGRYLMVMLIFGVAIFPYVERNYRRWLIAILPLSSIFLLLTYTRSAIIGASVGLLVVGLLQSKRLLALVIILSVSAMIFIPNLGSRFTEVADESSPSQERETNTLEWRLNQWSALLPLARTNPVTGIGLAAAQYEIENERQPHNDFIRAFVEAGIIGLVAYLWVVMAVMGLGRRAVIMAPRGTLDRGVAVGFLGCAIAFVAVSAVANVMSNVVLLWYFNAFAAAASGVVRRNADLAALAANSSGPGERPAVLPGVRSS
jgi:putative inorganic carbon (HCO3(-)) transporter